MCLCRTCAEGNLDDYELDIGEDGSLPAHDLSSTARARLLADCDNVRKRKKKSA